MKEIKISETYFQEPGLSVSFLKLFDRGPAYAFTGWEPSAAMREGTLIHTYLLENDLFFQRYVVAPPECQNRKNKPYPEFAKSIDDGREIILQREFDGLARIADRIGEFQFLPGTTVGSVLKDAKKEHAFFWQDGDTLKKGKMDLLIEINGHAVIMDLKTIDNANDFPRSVNQYSYHRQAAWYIDGVSAITGLPTLFYFLCVEKDAPHGVKMFELDPDYITAGRVANARSVAGYQSWKSAGADMLITYPNGVETIYKPKWLD